MITLVAALSLVTGVGCVPPSAGAPRMSPTRTLTASLPATSLPATEPYEQPRTRETAPEPERGDLSRDILRWTNVERLSAGLQPLAWSDRLARAARGHSEEMVRLNYFSHTSPVAENKTPMRRAEKAGVRSESLLIAENIAMGTFTDADARAIVKMWMDSRGHRENILRPSVRYLGIGVAYQGRELWATQLFSNTP